MSGAQFENLMGELRAIRRLMERALAKLEAGSDPREVGRELVAQIAAAERRGGADWRQRTSR